MELIFSCLPGVETRAEACGGGHAEGRACSCGKLILSSGFLQSIVVRAVSFRLPLIWMAENLLRHTGFVGLREDKPADRCGASGGSEARPDQPRLKTGSLCAGAHATRQSRGAGKRPDFNGWKSGSRSLDTSQRGPRRPSKRRPAQTGEKAPRFPLPRSRPAEGQVAGSNNLLGRRRGPASRSLLWSLSFAPRNVHGQTRAGRAFPPRTTRAKALEGRSRPRSKSFAGNPASLIEGGSPIGAALAALGRPRGSRRLTFLFQSVT